MADLTAEQIAELDRMEREAAEWSGRVWVYQDGPDPDGNADDAWLATPDVTDERGAVHSCIVALGMSDEDAQFVAALRTHARSLLDEREALRRERDEARTATNFNRDQYRIAFDRVQALEAARFDARDEVIEAAKAVVDWWTSFRGDWTGAADLLDLLASRFVTKLDGARVTGRDEP